MLSVMRWDWRPVTSSVRETTSAGGAVSHPATKPATANTIQSTFFMGQGLLKPSTLFKGNSAASPILQSLTPPARPLPVTLRTTPSCSPHRLHRFDQTDSYL